ncbi:MAG: endolytic transglycosylase MltG [Candidatus Tumulicola sp.]
MKRAAKIAGGTAALVLVAALAAVAWLWNAAYRNRSTPVAQTQVVIVQGSTFGEVARQLAAAGVIDNVLVFRLLARMRGEETEVRAGEYRFPPRQTQNEVLRALISGGAQVAAWVTVPEGFTGRQIAERLQEAGIGPADEFARAFARDSIVVDGKRTKNLEGFLFPSTYLIPLGASPQQVESTMTREFFRRLPPDAAAQARRLHVSVPQAITVASLIEREAKIDADRPAIAGVVYNRLRLGMPLEVDATIEYALPQHKRELLLSDLKIDSPYNSYTHAGLPPTPIANPGRPSMEAALHPSKTGFLYYVYCGNGRHVFANTLSEHQANVARCLH